MIVEVVCFGEVRAYPCADIKHVVKHPNNDGGVLVLRDETTRVYIDDYAGVVTAWKMALFMNSSDAGDRIAKAVCNLVEQASPAILNAVSAWTNAGNRVGIIGTAASKVHDAAAQWGDAAVKLTNLFSERGEVVDSIKRLLRKAGG